MCIEVDKKYFPTKLSKGKGVGMGKTSESKTHSRGGDLHETSTCKNMQEMYFWIELRGFIGEL